MDTPPAPALQVDAYVDVVCPWCWIGKRQLERALATFAAHPDAPDVHLRWHSVQLIPDVPPQGLDYTAFYEQRLGGAQNVRARQAQVRQAADAASLELQFERIRHFPNTQSAHQLLAYAGERLGTGAQGRLLDALLCAYFQRGVDIGDVDALLRLAQDNGLDPVDAALWLRSGHGVPAPVQVPGVPFFVFNHRLTLSGAQPHTALLATLQAALQAAPQASSTPAAQATL